MRYVIAKTSLSRGLAATLTVLGTALAVLAPRAAAARAARRRRPRLPQGATRSSLAQLQDSGELSVAHRHRRRAGTSRRAPSRSPCRSPMRSRPCSASAASFLGVFLASFTIVFICIFLLTDIERAQAGACERADAGRGRTLARTCGSGSRSVSRWAIGVVVIAVIAGTTQGADRLVARLELRRRPRPDRGPARHDPEHRRDDRRLDSRPDAVGRGRPRRPRSSCSWCCSPTSRSRTTSSRPRFRARR